MEVVLGKEGSSRVLLMVAEESGYFAAHGTYGGPAGLRRLVDASHGLRLDAVHAPGDRLTALVPFEAQKLAAAP